MERVYICVYVYVYMLYFSAVIMCMNFSLDAGMLVVLIFNYPPPLPLHSDVK